MADYSESRKKIRSRSLQRRRQSTLWTWCLLIEGLLSLPCVFSEFLDIDNTVSIYPPGEIKVEYGQPLEIFCVTEKYSSSDIQFSIYQGNHLTSEVVNRTTRRLYIEKPEKQSSTYYCSNNKNGKNCITRVLVESPPTDVTDFNCISYNLEILNCSWTSIHSLSKINYSVTFSIKHSLASTTFYFEKVISRSKIYCAWNITNKPKYRQQEEKQYFYLTACNDFGCNNQNFTIDHFSIVKPEPPYDLQVIENRPHSVDLMWRIPDNMVDLLHCGLDHIIEYQIAKIDNTTQFHRVNASFLPAKNKTYRFQLANLPYAHKQYEVRVFIKSKRTTIRELWSDFSYHVFYTTSERPKRPPDTITGAFHKSANSNDKVIYVYWKQLEEYEEAGTNFTYKVLVSQGNKTQTVYSDKNKSSSYVTLNATLNALDITVWSVNDKGSSLNSSHLYIPPEEDNHSLRPTSFTILAYENGTYELSWVAINNIDNYSLFWCERAERGICVGRMDFTVLDSKKSNHVIDLPREYRYQFAIAANNGSKTSGMIWANCDISQNGSDIYGSPIYLVHDTRGNTSITLKFSIYCALRDGIITGYNITYCPIFQATSKCDKSFNNSHKIIFNPKQMQAKMENLIPFTTYKFSFFLHTIYGQKAADVFANAFITTSEVTPKNTFNVSISDIKSTSLVISWDTPIYKNVIIAKYVIYNYDKEIYFVDDFRFNITHRQAIVTDLQSFSNYSIAVQACAIPMSLCSKLKYNDYVNVTTKIGSPSRLTAPTVKHNIIKLNWKRPEIPGGRVDLYEIQIIKDDLAPEIINTTELSYALEYCEGVVSSETYQVRAVNFYETLSENGEFERAVGPWSEPTTVQYFRHRPSRQNLHLHHLNNWRSRIFLHRSTNLRNKLLPKICPYKNSVIGKYVIYNYDKEIYYVDNVSGTDTSQRQVTFTGLESFTHYSLTVQACNIHIGLCSKLRSNDFVTVTTKMGSPSRLRPPIVKTNPNKLYWKPPEIPGGRLDLYEIQRIKDDSAPEIINTTELWYALDYCEGVVFSETYQVRAVNFYVTVSKEVKYESDAFVGAWSEPTTVVCWGLTCL